MGSFCSALLFPFSFLLFPLFSFLLFSFFSFPLSFLFFSPFFPPSLFSSSLLPLSFPPWWCPAHSLCHAVDSAALSLAEVSFQSHQSSASATGRAPELGLHRQQVLAVPKGSHSGCWALADTGNTKIPLSGSPWHSRCWCWGALAGCCARWHRDGRGGAALLQEQLRVWDCWGGCMALLGSIHGVSVSSHLSVGSVVVWLDLHPTPSPLPRSPCPLPGPPAAALEDTGTPSPSLGTCQSSPGTELGWHRSPSTARGVPWPT